MRDLEITRVLLLAKTKRWCVYLTQFAIENETQTDDVCYMRKCKAFNLAVSLISVDYWPSYIIRNILGPECQAFLQPSMLCLRFSIPRGSYKINVHKGRVNSDLKSTKRIPWNIYDIFTFLFLTYVILLSSGLVVSMLASGTRVRVFNPGRSRWIFPV
jgi:hypothetical protein